MRYAFDGGEGRWSATRLALIFGGVSSVLTVIGFAQTGWRLPDIPQVTVVPAVLGEILSALLIGMTVDELKKFATTRLRAAAVGVAAWVPAAILMYVFLLPPLTALQFVAYVGFQMIVGLVAGAVLWDDPDDE